MNGVKVSKTVVGAVQVGQNPRHVCLAEGVCLAARVNTCPAVQQQSSSAADKGWLCPRCHPAWASEGTPVGPGKDIHRTLGPEQQEGCGWPVWIRQQVHGKRCSGAGCQEQVVNVTGRLVAKEWNKVPQETYNAKSRRVAWVDVQQKRRGDGG